MSNLPQDLIVFKTDHDKIQVNVKLDQETIWLNLNQLATLFERDKSVISRHLKNIFQEDELDENSVVANFATTALDSKTYQVEYYNLDAIISVGYRVNSKRGIQFRKWASGILKDHLIQGYSLHQDRLHEKGITDLQKAIDLLAQTLQKNELVNDIGHHTLEIIKHYAKTWNLLLSYDENNLSYPEDLIPSNPTIEYEAMIPAIEAFKQNLIKKGEATSLFGKQKDKQLQAIFANLHQTFDEILLYPSSIERAAHLLYFVIKDHPFVDGNKRIGSLLFLIYLKSQNYTIFSINDSTLVALALLVAESNPKDKDLLIKLIMNLIIKN